MTTHQLKEELVFNKHFPKLCNVIIDIDKLLPYFVPENVISTDDLDEINAVPSTKKTRVQKLMSYISGPLKGGNTQPFYTMLKIMEDYGNQATEQLAKQLRSAIINDNSKDGTKEINSNNEVLPHNHQFKTFNETVKKYFNSNLFKGVLVLLCVLVALLFLILIFMIYVIMELEVLNHQMSMQNDPITHKHSTCDCNRLEGDMVSEKRVEVTKGFVLSQELIDAIYKTTNSWYLQLLIKSSIDHSQVAPAYLSVHNDNKNQDIVLTKPFFTFEGGHLMSMRVFLNGYGDDKDTHTFIVLHLLKGPHDDKLEQSGHFPLQGTFTIELLNPQGNYDHHGDFYLINSDVCIECTERVMHEGFAKGYGSRFISQNKLHDYYKNDTLYFRISYSTCHSCVCLKFSLRLLMLFIMMHVIDSIFIFVLLVIIEFCRGLMETSKLVFGFSSIDYNLIEEILTENATKKMMVIGLIVATDALTIAVWEFMGLLTYFSVEITRNAIFRIFFVSVFCQVVNTFSYRNKNLVVVSPMFLIWIFMISDTITVVATTTSIIIIFCNVYVVLYTNN